MAEDKIEVLFRISEVNLARAEKRFQAAEYDSAVFHASMAVETAANAMILDLGGDEAKDHRAISGLAAVLRRVKPELLREERYAQLIERGRRIQREVVYTRYPLKLAGEWVTPMEYYTQQKARGIIDNAKYAVDQIERYLKRRKNLTT
ncbi:HEPN domain-containing protein [Candidatus Bathyarchaeota archaeon]|nr:HEPN domain-containing protein [Candidatus Bathyarchaeota archaeon]NIU81528.1 HEPN domain-containing protein [Candidatus Bathyarchaeota archaeon]NIV68176.1 HEPN domain-containing protein [Candidatus Bathyarchaeota archaeon]